IKVVIEGKAEDLLEEMEKIKESLSKFPEEKLKELEKKGYKATIVVKEDGTITVYNELTKEKHTLKKGKVTVEGKGEKKIELPLLTAYKVASDIVETLRKGIEAGATDASITLEYKDGKITITVKVGKLEKTLTVDLEHHHHHH
uniref:De novo design protein n=1 Tax=synthetic construct TaxID=32630 RepID=UPI0035A3D6D6